MVETVLSKVFYNVENTPAEEYTLRGIKSQ